MISNFFVVVAIILHRIDNIIMVCKKDNDEKNALFVFTTLEYFTRVLVSLKIFNELRG